MRGILGLVWHEIHLLATTNLIRIMHNAHMQSLTTE